MLTKKAKEEIEICLTVHSKRSHKSSLEFGYSLINLSNRKEYCHLAQAESANA